MNNVDELEQATHYRVVTSSFLWDGAVYKAGDLLVRNQECPQMDYALGSKLIELYYPEDEIEEVAPQPRWRLGGLVARFLGG